MADRHTSHRYSMIPEIIKLLGRKRMTTDEVSAEIGMHQITTRNWLDAFVEAGIVMCDPRLSHRGPGKKPLEYWLLSCWGGEA